MAAIQNSLVHILIIIIIVIKGIYIAQVCKGHKCAMSAEMAVWLRLCLCSCFVDAPYFFTRTADIDCDCAV